MALSSILKRRKRPGVLAAIYVAGEAGAPMVSEVAAKVEAGRGLNNDRYANGEGFYQAADACQVTIIDGDQLERIERRTGIQLTHGEHRRNLVVSGIAMTDLEGRRIRIGSVLFEYYKPRPPCGYLEAITEPGMVKALKRHFGACLGVLESGTIRVGDRIAVELTA